MPTVLNRAEHAEKVATSTLLAVLGKMNEEERAAYMRFRAEGRSKSDALDLVYQARQAVRAR